MADTPFQPNLPLEVPFTDAELAHLEDSPPGMFPDNQNSNYGLIHRKFFSDFIQELINQQQTIYNEHFASTTTQYMDEWERQVGLPPANPSLTIQARRQSILGRLARGPFTRTRRAGLVEQYIVATFGPPVLIDPSGIALTAAGVPLYSEAAPVQTLYKIVENIPAYTYTVRIKNTVFVDMVGLTREIDRITPGGIAYSIVSVADPFTEVTPYGGIPSATLSGNEITDAVRTTKTQGDGRVVESSMGIWEATTNLITNGGFETNLTGWTGSVGGCTQTRDTTKAKFGTASLKSVGTAVNQYFFSNISTLTGATAGLVFTASVWVDTSSVPVGRTIYLGLRETGGATGTADSLAVITPAVSGWQRVTLTRTIVQNDRTGVQIYLQIPTGVVGDTFWIDGAQLEQKLISTPYVETNGATATRAVSRVQASAALIDETQGWFAVRMRMGFSNAIGTGQVSQYPTPFNWSDNTNNRISARFAPNSLALERVFNVASAPSPAPSISFVLGDFMTYIGRWTATSLGVSVNGSTFMNIANSSIPNLAATTFDIGTLAGVGMIDSEILWFMCGTGTLTDADAVTLNALGNTEPTATTLPAAANFKAIFPMVDATFRVAV